MSGNQVIYILNIFDEVIGQLNNELPNGCPFWEDKHIEKLENGYETFEFYTVINHPTDFPNLLENENKVGFVNKDGDFKLFRIKIVDDETQKNERYIWAELDSVELYNTVARPMELSGSPRQYLETILSGTRWGIGTVEDLATQKVSFDDYISVIQAIHEGRSKFRAEVNFRFELDNGQIVGRYVDMVSRLGVETGKRVEYSKDLIKFKRTRDTTELATALIGVGKADSSSKRLTFKDTIWNTSQGDPVNKPLGQDWIGDDELLSAYSPDGRHIYRVFDDGETDDAESLIYNTWERLQQIKNGLYTYEIDILLIEDITGYEGDRLRKGDTLIVVDRTFSTPLYISARVLEIERSKANPLNDKVLLGEFRELKLSIPAHIQDLQNRIIKDSPKWERVPNADEVGAIPEGGIKDSDFPDEKPPTPTGFKVKGLFKTIKLSWDYIPHSYIAAYEVYGSLETGFTPDSTNLIWRGKTGGFIHEAELGQTWYYKLRAVNTRGTGSDFTEELSASTIKIMTDDMLFGSVTADLIADLAIEAKHLAAAAVGEEALAEGAVSESKIARLAVGTAAIQNAAIKNVHLGTAIIDTAQIMDLAVVDAHIGNVSADKITAGTIDANDITVINLKAENILGTLYTVGRGNSTYLNLSTSDQNSHYIKSYNAAGFRIESDGSLSFKSDAAYSIRFLNAPVIVDNNLAVGSFSVGGTARFDGVVDFNSMVDFNFDAYFYQDVFFRDIANFQSGINVYGQLGSTGQILSDGTHDSGNGSFGYFRHRGNPSNYFRIGNAGGAVIVGGTTKATWASLPKVTVEPSGDGIYDGKEFGVNNIGSMQPLLTDFINIQVDGTKEVILDEKFLEFVSGFNVFTSDGKVISKTSNSFTIEGTGLISCIVIGIQKGKEDVVGYSLESEQKARELVGEELEPIERIYVPRKLREGGIV